METFVLLSSGIDSAACVAFYRQLGHSVSGLFVDYCQPVRVRRLISCNAAGVVVEVLGHFHNFGKQKLE